MTVPSTRRHPVAQLQRIVAEEITEPAEQQVLDDQRRQARDRGAEEFTPAPQSALVARMLELCRPLPSAERGTLLARLVAELPAEQQFGLLALVLARLPVVVLQPLEGE